MNQDLIGRGWAFPVVPDSTGRLRVGLGEEKVRQSIDLILSTAPGERVMRPAFGCGIHELVFHPNTAQTQGMVAERVRDALRRWEPRIDVVSVEVTPGDDPELGRDHLRIVIEYRLRENNALYNQVYPFFLTEGAH